MDLNLEIRQGDFEVRVSIMDATLARDLVEVVREVIGAGGLRTGVGVEISKSESRRAEGVVHEVPPGVRRVDGMDETDFLPGWEPVESRMSNVESHKSDIEGELELGEGAGIAPPAPVPVPGAGLAHGEPPPVATSGEVESGPQGKAIGRAKVRQAWMSEAAREAVRCEFFEEGTSVDELARKEWKTLGGEFRYFSRPAIAAIITAERKRRKAEGWKVDPNGRTAEERAKLNKARESEQTSPRPSNTEGAETTEEGEAEEPPVVEEDEGQRARREADERGLSEEAKREILLLHVEQGLSAVELAQRPWLTVGGKKRWIKARVIEGYLTECEQGNGIVFKPAQVSIDEIIEEDRFHRDEPVKTAKVPEEADGTREGPGSDEARAERRGDPFRRTWDITPDELRRLRRMHLGEGWGSQPKSWKKLSAETWMCTDGKRRMFHEKTLQAVAGLPE